MASLGRYCLPDQSLHVIQRGNNREPVFFASDDYLRETVRLMSFKAKAANTRAGNIMTIVAAER